MLFSKLLNHVEIDDNIDILSDRDIEGWGTLNSSPHWDVFTYVDDIQYAEVGSPFFKLILTTKDISESIKNKNIGIALCKNPQMTFWRLHNALENYVSEHIPRVPSRIAASSKVSELAVIDPYNVEIEDDCIIEPFVVIHAGTRIGRNTIIRSGTEIGGIGFEYKKWDNMTQRIPHYGGVLIGDNVDIHYNCCVSRGVFVGQNTVIGNNTKIDDLTHISHGVQIGNDVMVAAGTVIGGSTIVNSGTWVGLGSTLKHGLFIDENAVIGMGSVLGHDMGAGDFVLGNPARRLK